MLQVLPDHPLCHLPHRHTEVPTRPKISHPVSLLQGRKLFKQPARRVPFDPPRDLAGRHIRRRTHQYVHVVLAPHPAHYPDLKRRAHLPDQLSDSLSNLRCQHLLPVLRHPHKVILKLKYRVTAISVVHLTPPASPFSQLELIGWKPVVLNSDGKYIIPRLRKLKYFHPSLLWTPAIDLLATSSQYKKNYSWATTRDSNLSRRLDRPCPTS